MNPIKLHRKFAEQGLNVIIASAEDVSENKQVFIVKRDDEHKRKFMRVCREMGCMNQVFQNIAHLYFYKKSFSYYAA